MRTTILAGFGAALLAVAGMGFLAHRNAGKFIETQRWVVHTNEVIAELQSGFAAVRAAESCMRGYLLTAEDSMLQEYEGDREKASSRIGRLQELTRDNPAQQERLRRLKERVAGRFQLLDEIRVIGRKDGIEAARSRVVAGQRLIGEIRDLVGELEGEERRLLEIRNAESVRVAEKTRLLYVLTTIASVAGFAVLSFAMIRFFEARRRVERELDQFFSTSLDLMAVASLRNGTFTRMSPSWERALGWTPGELTGKPWLDFVHPDDRAATIAEAGKLAQGVPVLTFENRYRCRDGSYRWLSWKTPAPLPGSDALYAVARDVTELKQHEEVVRRLNEDLARRMEETVAANKELESFSYSVSHDLRAPLRAIDGFARILLEDYGDRLDGEGRRLFGVVRENSRQMGQLIDDLLQYSRLGRKELEKVRVDMGELARAAVDEQKAADPSRAVEVLLRDLPSARGDRVLLKQVWANLVGNAFKYSRTRTPARIEIGVESREGGTVYFVRDNGVGFDMKYAGKLFGVFQRLHGKTEFEGTGVGLAIVQRVVQRHGGRAWAEGEVGRGASFFFALPA